MSTTFKKGWYLGKPLQELLPNTKQFRYWYLGKPFPLFDKPAVPSTPITIQIDSALHLTLTKITPCNFETVFPETQSLTFSLLTPSLRAGVIESAIVAGSGVEVLYAPPEGAIVAGSGVEVLYAPPPVAKVTQEFIQVEYVEYGVQVDQVDVVVVAESVEGVQVNQAGVVVIYSVDGLFLVDIQHLTLALYTPTVIITAPEVLPQSLTLTLHAPIVTISFNVTTLPVVKHLTFSQKSPSVRLGCVAVANLVSLALTLHTPLVLIGAQVYETLEAVLTISSPTIGLSSRLTVSKLSLVLSLKAVTINHNVFVDISETLSLVFEVYTPAMRGGVNLDETLSLTLHQADVPTVAWGYTVSISAPKHLVLSLKSITIRVTKNVLVIVPHDGIETLTIYNSGHGYHLNDLLYPLTPVGTGALLQATEVIATTITQVTIINHGIDYVVDYAVLYAFVTPLGGAGFACIIDTVRSYPFLAINSIDCEALMGVSIKETLHVTLELHAPEIHAASVITVSVLHLALQKYSPTISIRTTNPVDLQSLVLNSYDVNVVIGYVIKITQVLTLHQYDVTVSYGSTITPDTLHLILTIYGPEIIAIPFEPYDIDPLHKEREWGSSYTLNNGEYASRSGSALSDRFPLQSDDEDKQITVCCWLRLKSLPSRQTIFAKLIDSSNISLGLHLLGGQPFLLWANAPDDVQPYPGLSFSKISLVINRWYHIGLVVDGVNRFAYLHVWDDKAKTITCQSMSADPFIEPYPRTALVVGDGDFNVGYSYGPYGMDAMWLNGYIDEFVVFNDLKSPFIIDQIRKGQYNGPTDGQGVGDFGVTAGYDPQGRIEIADFGATTGYDPQGRIEIADFGLTVAYSIPIPPPPSRFPVISGFPSPGWGGVSYTFCNLNYKFKSDAFSYDYNNNDEARASYYSLPNRELDTMIGISDESAYLRLSETLVAGATIYSVPIWAFRTVLNSNAHAGDLEFVANDVSNLYVGEKVLLVRAIDATIYDLCDITAIAGQTVSVATPLTLHHHTIQMPTHEFRYDERGCYVVPCITGFVDAQDVSLHGNKPGFWIHVKVNGGVWINAGHPEMISFTSEPAEAGLISPKVERTIVGTENGIIEMMPQLLTSRLAFQVEWYFKDESWKVLRDMFISARGKVTTIPMPTWCFELRSLATRAAGSTSIKLTAGFGQLWQRFSRLLAYPIYGGEPFVIQLTGHHAEGGSIQLTDVVPYGLVMNWSDAWDYVSFSGWLVGNIVPGSVTFTVTLGGYGEYIITDDGEGGLVNDDLSFGYIWYESGTILFAVGNIPSNPSSKACTVTYQYIPYPADSSYPEYYTCDALTDDLQVGDKITLYPSVRFLEDELVFEFLYYNECKVKASFIEVIS